MSTTIGVNLPMAARRPVPPKAHPLDDHAEAINLHHRHAKKFAEQAVVHAMDAGKLLIEVKAKLDHGQFLPWLRQHCEVSERQAQRYMRVAEYGEANPTRVSDMSLRGVLAELKGPTKASPTATKKTRPKRTDREAVQRQHVSQFSEWLRSDSPRTLGEYGVRVVDAADPKTLDRIEARIRERRAQLAESEELRKRAMKTA